jgi:hypothetical protein
MPYLPKLAVLVWFPVISFCKIFIPSYTFHALLCQNWLFSTPNCVTLPITILCNLHNVPFQIEVNLPSFHSWKTLIWKWPSVCVNFKRVSSFHKVWNIFERLFLGIRFRPWGPIVIGRALETLEEPLKKCSLLLNNLFNF